MSIKNQVLSLTLLAATAFAGPREDARVIVDRYNKAVSLARDLGISGVQEYHPNITDRNAQHVLKQVQQRTEDLVKKADNDKWNDCLEDSPRTFSGHGFCGNFSRLFLALYEIENATKPKPLLGFE